MKLIMDISKAENLSDILKECPDKIEIRRGRNYKDFDVVESSLPDELVDKLRDECRKNLKKRGDYNEENTESMPMGFDWSGIPHGVSIQVIRESQATAEEVAG